MNLKDLKEKINRYYPEAEKRVKYDLRFHLGRNLFEARIAAGKTQAQLAKLIKTRQPNIARIESGSTIPTIHLLEKMALAMGTYLVAPTFGNILYPNVVQTAVENTQEEIVLVNHASYGQGSFDHGYLIKTNAQLSYSK